MNPKLCHKCPHRLEINPQYADMDWGDLPCSTCILPKSSGGRDKDTDSIDVISDQSLEHGAQLLMRSHNHRRTS